MQLANTNMYYTVASIDVKYGQINKVTTINHLAR